MSLPCFAFDKKDLLHGRFDPEKPYFTIETQHFFIHHPEDLRALALELSHKLEAIHTRLVREMGRSSPTKTNVILSLKSDRPALYTAIHPYVQIYFDVALPDHSVGFLDFADWHEFLLIHEYSHRIHLDPELRAEKIFGRWLKPNMLMPTWLKEGLATYIETHLTPYGRGKSSFDKMILRVGTLNKPVLSEAFLSEAALVNPLDETWPWTFRPYVLGYELIRTMKERDSDAIRKITNGAANFSSVEQIIRDVGFKNFENLKDQTIKRLEQEHQPVIRKIMAKPLTSIEYLTQTGYLYNGLDLAPNGQWLITTRDAPKQQNAILKIDITDRENPNPDILVYRASGGTVRFSSSSRFVVYDQLTAQKRYYNISDIFIHDLKTNQIVAQSPFYHARDADIFPDGVSLVFVVNEQGRNFLVFDNTSFNAPQVVIDNAGYRRISTPRVSPDGRTIALVISNQTRGGEDLYLYDVASKTLRLIDMGGSVNRDPAWLPGENGIAFASDRDGVFNIYVYQPKSSRLFQVTNVIGGILHPVFDARMQYGYGVSYRETGFDVGRFKVNQTQWLDHGIVPARKINFFSDPIRPNPSLESRAYSVRHNLLPQYLFPNLVLRKDSTQYGFIFGATDDLLKHHYEFDWRYDHTTRYWNGSLFYYNALFKHPFDLLLSQDALLSRHRNEVTRTAQAETTLSLPADSTDRQFYYLFGAGYLYMKSAFTADYVFPKVGVSYDTEFQEIGRSFPQSGVFSKIEFKYFNNTQITADRQVGAFIDLRYHQPLRNADHILHGEIRSAILLSNPPDSTLGYGLGGRESFPFTGSTTFELNGYQPLSFESRRVALFNLLYTSTLKNQKLSVKHGAFFGGQTSLGFLIQSGVYDLDFNNYQAASSLGVKVYQEFVLGNILPFTADLGIYQGERNKTGETQIVLKISASK